MANYLCSKRRFRTAYIEINGTDEISSLADGDDTPFLCCEVTLYPDATFSRLGEILSHGFQFCILDFGLLHPNNYREFMQCDRGFVIGSIAPWKQDSYARFLKKYFPKKSEYSDHIRYLAALGIKDQVKSFSKRCRIPVTAFPYLEQPFQLSSADWQFFQLLLQGMD